VIGPGRSPDEITLTIGKDFRGVRRPTQHSAETLPVQHSDAASPHASLVAPHPNEDGAKTSSGVQPGPAAADTSATSTTSTTTGATERPGTTRTADSDICTGLPRPRSDAAVKPSKTRTGSPQRGATAPDVSGDVATLDAPTANPAKPEREAGPTTTSNTSPSPEPAVDVAPWPAVTNAPKHPAGGISRSAPSPTPAAAAAAPKSAPAAPDPVPAAPRQAAEPAISSEAPPQPNR
jgi:hypothetical protein